MAMMKRASISEAKNKLSSLIDQVRRGQSVIITDRSRPVAMLSPVDASLSDDDRLAALDRAGIITRGRHRLPDSFFKMPRGKSPPNATLLQAILDERRDGR